MFCNVRWKLAVYPPICSWTIKMLTSWCQYWLTPTLLELIATHFLDKQIMLNYVGVCTSLWLVHSWFHKIVFIKLLLSRKSLCIYVCVCLPPRVLKTICSRVTWHDVHHIHLVKQVQQFLCIWQPQSVLFVGMASELKHVMTKLALYKPLHLP